MKYLGIYLTKYMKTYTQKTTKYSWQKLNN